MRGIFIHIEHPYDTAKVAAKKTPFENKDELAVTLVEDYLQIGVINIHSADRYIISPRKFAIDNHNKIREYVFDFPPLQRIQKGVDENGKLVLEKEPLEAYFQRSKEALRSWLPSFARDMNDFLD